MIHVTDTVGNADKAEVGIDLSVLATKSKEKGFGMREH